MKLEVSCGDKERDGYIGMNTIPLEQTDIIHDMNVITRPSEDNSITEIIFDDIPKHSKNFPGMLLEMHRISSPGGIIKISVPHFSSDNTYSDPTHNIFFSGRSFNYFDKSLNYKHSFYLKEVNLKILKSYIGFRKYFTYDNKRPLFNPFKLFGIEFLVNKFPRIYERFFCWIIPAAEIYFELRVIK